MERTVPRSASDEIDLYLRTIYSLLRSTTEVQIRTLEEVHAGMNSSLHLDARKESPDTSAFIYSILRLPECISEVKSVIMGQNSIVFSHHDYPDVENWQQVYARARRRKSFYDGKGTLAVFIASQSDIEDLVPVLTAYQIEWNKMHSLLQKCPLECIKQITDPDSAGAAELAEMLGISSDDLIRLSTIWGSETLAMLTKMASQRCNFGIRLLSGSLSEYWRATRVWWDNIEQIQPKVMERPVYFISSNPHSIPNLLTGYALGKRDTLSSFITKNGDANLFSEWQKLQQSETQSSVENFFYYALKKIQQTEVGKPLIAEQNKVEADHGIARIPSIHSFDVDTQVIELSQLDPAQFDPRLLPTGDDGAYLKKSDALIINIDYPLGLGAYNILTKLAEHIIEVLGIYIMGKAATLNGVRGDIMIPNVVQDEHSQNTYLIHNALSAAEVIPYLVYGTALDNQKALTALGTFLQNARMMDVMYREGYTDIEMEAGPYLSAIYEMTRPKRHPINEIVNLQGVPFDIGILHYVSDTPLSKGKNLGAGTMSYEGMDSTYASSIAILRRILALERIRLK